MRSIKRLRTLVEDRRFTAKRLKGPWIAPETGDRDTNLHFIGLGRWDLPFIKTPGLPMHGRLRVPPRRDFFLSPEGKVYTVDVGVLPYAFVADHLKTFGLTLQDPYPFGEPEPNIERGYCDAPLPEGGVKGFQNFIFDGRRKRYRENALLMGAGLRHIVGLGGVFGSLWEGVSGGIKAGSGSGLQSAISVGGGSVSGGL